jgi:hypothetical protein
MKNKLIEAKQWGQLVEAGRTQLQKASNFFTQEYPATYGRKIEVRQLGLATGQRVFVRVIKRVHIPVTYIASE